jgi:hypothetical protein
VRDNTQVQRHLFHAVVGVLDRNRGRSTRDLRAGSGWGGSSYTGERVAGPFAVLDTVYTAMQKVLSVAPATAFPPLQVFWSPEQRARPAAAWRRARSAPPSSSTGAPAAEIYVLGKENVDTDEFDAPVIAHEWGHYYQAAFSRDDSPGGAHSTGERVDRRLAFSEGWGNAWSGIALGRSNYVDSGGARQAEGGNLDLSAARRPIRAGSGRPRSSRSSGTSTSRSASSPSTTR